MLPNAPMEMFIERSAQESPGTLAVVHGPLRRARAVCKINRVDLLEWSSGVRITRVIT